MIKVTVKEIGTPAFYAKLRKLENLDLTDVGEIMRNKMISVIDRKRKRPKKQDDERYNGEYTEHLEDTLQVVPMKGGIGLGDKATLDQLTPYWRLINDGGYLSEHGTHGVFTGRAFRFDMKGAKMVPHAMVSPMNYIEDTVAWTNLRITKFISEKVAKVLDTSDTRSKVAVKIK